MLECPICFSECDGLVWRMTTGDKTFLINRGDSQATIPTGSQVAGLGRGKFHVIKKPGDLDEDRDYRFSLMSPTDEVIFNGTLQTVQQLIGQHKKVDPTQATAVDHTMQAKPTASDPSAFTIHTKHEVAYRTPEFNLVEENMVKEAVDQHKVGAVASQKLWAASKCVAPVFLVRLTRKGFMPICPKLVTKFDIVLMPCIGIQLL